MLQQLILNETFCPWRMFSDDLSRLTGDLQEDLHEADEQEISVALGEGIDSIAGATYWLIHGRELFLFLHLLGLTCFAYIVARRLAPLLRAQRDFRFDRPWTRLGRVLQFWLGQWRHPRYRFAGALHLLIFAGFLILAARAFALLGLGISDRFAAVGSGRTVRNSAGIRLNRRFPLHGRCGNSPLVD